MSQPASFPSPGGQAENQGTAAFAADPIQTQNGGADAPASSKDLKKKGKKTVANPRRVRLAAFENVETFRKRIRTCEIPAAARYGGLGNIPGS